MWAIFSTLKGLVMSSVSKIYIYAGIAVVGLVAIASILAGARKAGRDAEQAKQAKARLEAVAHKRKIDREINKLDDDRLMERAMRWAKD